MKPESTPILSRRDFLRIFSSSILSCISANAVNELEGHGGTNINPLIPKNSPFYPMFEETAMIINQNSWSLQRYEEIAAIIFGVFKQLGNTQITREQFLKLMIGGGGLGLISLAVRPLTNILFSSKFNPEAVKNSVISNPVSAALRALSKYNETIYTKPLETGIPQLEYQNDSLSVYVFQTPDKQTVRLALTPNKPHLHLPTTLDVDSPTNNNLITIAASPQEFVKALRNIYQPPFIVIAAGAASSPFISYNHKSAIKIPPETLAQFDQDLKSILPVIFGWENSLLIPSQQNPTLQQLLEDHAKYSTTETPLTEYHPQILQEIELCFPDKTLIESFYNTQIAYDGKLKKAAFSVEHDATINLVVKFRDRDNKIKYGAITGPVNMIIPDGENILKTVRDLAEKLDLEVVEFFSGDTGASTGIILVTENDVFGIHPMMHQVVGVFVLGEMKS